LGRRRKVEKRGGFVRFFPKNLFPSPQFAEVPVQRNMHPCLGKQFEHKVEIKRPGDNHERPGFPRFFFFSGQDLEN